MRLVHGDRGKLRMDETYPRAARFTTRPKFVAEPRQKAFQFIQVKSSGLSLNL